MATNHYHFDNTDHAAVQYSASHGSLVTGNTRISSFRVPVSRPTVGGKSAAALAMMKKQHDQMLTQPMKEDNLCKKWKPPAAKKTKTARKERVGSKSVIQVPAPVPKSILPPPSHLDNNNNNNAVVHKSPMNLPPLDFPPADAVVEEYHNRLAARDARPEVSILVGKDASAPIDTSAISNDAVIDSKIFGIYSPPPFTPRTESYFYGDEWFDNHLHEDYFVYGSSTGNHQQQGKRDMNVDDTATPDLSFTAHNDIDLHQYDVSREATFLWKGLPRPRAPTSFNEMMELLRMANECYMYISDVSSKVTDYIFDNSSDTRNTIKSLLSQDDPTLRINTREMELFIKKLKELCDPPLFVQPPPPSPMPLTPSAPSSPAVPMSPPSTSLVVVADDCSQQAISENNNKNNSLETIGDEEDDNNEMLVVSPHREALPSSPIPTVAVDAVELPMMEDEEKKEEEEEQGEIKAMDDSEITPVALTADSAPLDPMDADDCRDIHYNPTNDDCHHDPMNVDDDDNSSLEEAPKEVSCDTSNSINNPSLEEAPKEVSCDTSNSINNHNDESNAILDNLCESLREVNKILDAKSSERMQVISLDNSSSSDDEHGVSVEIQKKAEEKRRKNKSPVLSLKTGERWSKRNRNAKISDQRCATRLRGAQQKNLNGLHIVMNQMDEEIDGVWKTFLKQASITCEVVGTLAFSNVSDGSNSATEKERILKARKTIKTFFDFTGEDFKNQYQYEFKYKNDLEEAVRMLERITLDLENRKDDIYKCIEKYANRSSKISTTGFKNALNHRHD